MTNLEEVDPADEPRTYRAGPLPASGSKVVLAGVTVNLLIAFLLFFVVIAGQGRVRDGPSTTVSAVVGGQRRARGRPADRRQDRRRRRRSRSPAGTSSSRRSRRSGGDADRRSPSSATAQQVDARRHPEACESGQGFLGRRPDDRVPRRRRARGGARDVQVDGHGLHRLHRRPRRPALAVGREPQLQQELHLGGAEGGIARPTSTGPCRSSASSTPAASSSASDIWVLAAACSAQISFILARVQPAADPARSTAGTRSSCVYEWVASKVQAPPGRGRLPQADPGQRGAAHPDPVPRAVVDGPRHPPARSVARPVPIDHDVAAPRSPGSIHVGDVRGGRRRAGHRAVDDHHEDGRRRRHARADLLARRRRLRHRALHVQRGSRGRGAGADRAPLAGAAHRRHPLPVQARARGDGGRRAGAAAQPGQHPQARAHQGRRARGQGPRPARSASA